MIDILIREMENRKDKVCVILAGYTNEMKEFIEMNSGLKSRVNFVIDFENYTNDELFAIFEKYLKEDDLFVNEKCKQVLTQYFLDIRKVGNFGNAREIRNIAEQLKMIQANRVIKSSGFVNRNEITLDDINVVIERNRSKYEIENKKVIGFL